MNHHKIVALALLLAFLSAPVASADVLVTKEGARVETQGPWEVRGRQVIFTTPKGVLSSMRLAEVDLEASARADCPDIAQIHWFWGDGRASYSWFPAEHTYEQPGRYQVVVTARDLEGHETVAKTTVTIR